MLIDSICTQETQLLFDIKIQHSEGLGFLSNNTAHVCNGLHFTHI
jgi:hypothetical protein